jgi:hypothetical protein
VKSVRDIAIDLHVSEERVRIWIRSGKMKASKKDGCWTVKDEDFMIFLADRPKYNNRYFIETFGHRPPAKVSKRAEKLLSNEPRQDKHGLKHLLSDINNHIGDDLK